jgi:hypothetical protein
MIRSFVQRARVSELQVQPGEPLKAGMLSDDRFAGVDWRHKCGSVRGLCSRPARRFAHRVVLVWESACVSSARVWMPSFW